MKSLHRALVALIAIAGLALGAAGLAGAAPLFGTITSITPASGPVAGGTSITIEGADFRYGSSGPAVTVGGMDAPITSFVEHGAMGEGTIVATTPAGAAGKADVKVIAADPSYNGMVIAESLGGFTYVDPAPVSPATTVSSVAPASGLTTGGESITITGAGFATGATVTIGGQQATDVAVASATTLTATTPAHAAGATDVTVTVGSDSGTKAGAYTYNQGYWLTVSTRRPAAIGQLTSPGAIRTPAAGTWASNATTTAGKDTTTTHTGYTGGINCGQRGVTLIDKGIFSSGTGTKEAWDTGACRYAFAAGSNVNLSALTSSYQDNWLFSLPWKTQYGFLGGWGGDCPATTAGSSCSVAMSTDRAVTATWGFASFGFLKIFADVTLPVFASDGSVQYFTASGIASSPPTILGGTPSYVMYAFMPAATAQSRESAASTPNGRMACRATARVIGRRITATCKVTPVLARALAAGTVRLRTRWYMRPPHQSTPVLIHGGRVTLRNRRATPITG